MVSWVVLLVGLAGLVMFLVPGNGDRKQVGFAMFACALMALCFALAGKTVRPL